MDLLVKNVPKHGRLGSRKNRMENYDSRLSVVTNMCSMDFLTQGVIGLFTCYAQVCFIARYREGDNKRLAPNIFHVDACVCSYMYY